MKGYSTSLERKTRENTDFRHVVYTGKHSQLVLMSLKPGEEIGEETHTRVDQFFNVVKGNGVVVIDGRRHHIYRGSGIVIPAGAKHNVINSSRTTELKLSTIDSPPEHHDRVVRHTRASAMSRPEEYDGKTSE